MKILKYTFFVSAVIFILLQIFYYPQMPHSVAIHFDVHGQVNGWMTKDANLLMSCLIVIIITVSFVGVPSLLKRISADLISIPQKEYWLTANNRERLMRIVSTYLYSIGLTTNIFMIYLFHELYRFNIHAIDKISIIAIVPLLIIIIGCTIHLFMRLNKTL